MHTIAFTGSLPVGLEIMRAAADVVPGQHHIKRVVAELGGKNCVIVDSDADLDEAVPGIVSSAFVYAGQKCSAAARVLVHEAIADALIERVAGAVQVLVVGQASDLGTDVPPVIERRAQERVERYVATAAREGRIVVGGDGEGSERRLVLPADRRDRPAADVGGPRARRSSVRCSRSSGSATSQHALRHRRRAAVRAHRRPVRPRSRRPSAASARALRSATCTSTVGSPERWSAASRSAATGSPGTGTKAGGPDYLLHFVEPRAVTENTMRHGLVV